MSTQNKDKQEKASERKMWPELTPKTLNVSPGGWGIRMSDLLMELRQLAWRLALYGLSNTFIKGRKRRSNRGRERG